MIHLIAITLTTFSSSYYLSSNKRNWNISNTFNNEVISPLFGFIIFAVYYIMVRKGNHLIVYFIEVVQYKLLSWRSIFFNQKVYTRYNRFFFIRCSINIEFPFLNQCRMIDIFQQGFNICNECVIYDFLFFIGFCLNIGRM